VTVEVVDRDKCCRVRGRDRLRRHKPDQEGSDEPRTLGHRDDVDLRHVRAGTAQRIVDHRPDQIEVLAGGDLGHHAAIAVMDSLR